MAVAAANVAGVAIALSVASFAAFAAITWIQLTAVNKQAADAAKAGTTEALAAPADYTKLLEAIAKLVDSFTKAGPGLSALAASVLFLVIAAYATTSPKSDAAPKPAIEQKQSTPASK